LKTDNCIGSYTLGIFLLLFILLSDKLYAQFDTQSPYSFYGIGSLQRNSLQNGSGMGEISAGLRDSNTINYLNPAAYTAIDVTHFVFGFENNVINRSISNRPYRDVNTYINQVGLGMPLIKKRHFGWGVYMGFSPYSQVGYSFADTVTQYFGNDTVQVKSLYNGNGGINQVTLGNGFRLSKYVSVGANAHFIFGNTDRNRSLIMPLNQGYLSSRVQEKVNVREFSVDVGIQVHHWFKTQKRIRPNEMPKDSVIPRHLWPVKTSRIYFNIGVSYTPGRTITASYDQLGIQFISGSTELGVDTFNIVPTQQGIIRLPHLIKAGIHFTNAQSWCLAADFNYGKWSDFRYFDQPLTLYHDSWGVSLGTEIDPPYRNKNLGKNLFFKNILYRAGIRYQNRYFRPDSNPIDEVGISFGLGLPLAFGNKVYSETESRRILSYININLEVGFANSRNGGLIHENFFRLNIGITIRDKWFIKRRFN
jgi:hypothetical protein